MIIYIILYLLFTNLLKAGFVIPLLDIDLIFSAWFLSKLVRCISGEIFDVAIDIRKNSATFGLWVGEVLSSQNKNQLWIPEGFAHGFLTISESAEVCYKTTNFWDKDSEKSIIWNDKNINIKWPLYKLKNKKIILSDKDEKCVLKK